MDKPIDFSTYSLEELYSSAEKIDRQQYPERAVEIDKLIKEKEQEYPEQLVDQKAAGNEATRVDRLLGAIIDGVVQVIATIPFVMYHGMEKIAEPNFMITMQGLFYGLTVTITIQGYLLYYYSQTVGKHFMGTRIEDLKGQRANTSTIIKRIVPMNVISIIPIVGQFIVGLVNPLCIFGKEKRCLHDYIAQTRVCYVNE